MAVAAHPASAQRGRTQVNVVGDSITYLTASAIAKVFGPANWTTSIVGKPGATMTDMLPAIESLRTTSPADWVIELGTNDAFLNNPDWWSAFWTEVSTLGSQQQCVIMATPSVLLQPIAGYIHISIYYAGLLHPNFHMLDWGTFEYANASWLEPDQIHPTPAGQAELAGLIKDAVLHDCA